MFTRRAILRHTSRCLNYSGVVPKYASEVSAADVGRRVATYAVSARSRMRSEDKALSDTKQLVQDSFPLISSSISNVMSFCIGWMSVYFPHPMNLDALIADTYDVDRASAAGARRIARLRVLTNIGVIFSSPAPRLVHNEPIPSSSLLQLFESLFRLMVSIGSRRSAAHSEPRDDAHSILPNPSAGGPLQSELRTPLRMRLAHTLASSAVIASARLHPIPPSWTSAVPSDHSAAGAALVTELERLGGPPCVHHLTYRRAAVALLQLHALTVDVERGMHRPSQSVQSVRSAAARAFMLIMDLLATTPHGSPDHESSCPLADATVPNAAAQLALDTPQTTALRSDITGPLVASSMPAPVPPLPFIVADALLRSPAAAGSASRAAQGQRLPASVASLMLRVAATAAPPNAPFVLPLEVLAVGVGGWAGANSGTQGSGARKGPKADSAGFAVDPTDAGRDLRDRRGDPENVSLSGTPDATAPRAAVSLSCVAVLLRAACDGAVPPLGAGDAVGAPPAAANNRNGDENGGTPITDQSTPSVTTAAHAKATPKGKAVAKGKRRFSNVPTTPRWPDTQASLRRASAVAHCAVAMLAVAHTDLATAVAPMLDAAALGPHAVTTTAIGAAVAAVGANPAAYALGALRGVAVAIAASQHTRGALTAALRRPSGDSEGIHRHADVTAPLAAVAAAAHAAVDALAGPAVAVVSLAAKAAAASGSSPEREGGSDAWPEVIAVADADVVHARGATVVPVLSATGVSADAFLVAVPSRALVAPSGKGPLSFPGGVGGGVAWLHVPPSAGPPPLSHAEAHWYTPADVVIAAAVVAECAVAMASIATHAADAVATAASFRATPPPPPALAPTPPSPSAGGSDADNLREPLRPHHDESVADTTTDVSAHVATASTAAAAAAVAAEAAVMAMSDALLMLYAFGAVAYRAPTASADPRGSPGSRLTQSSLSAYSLTAGGVTAISGDGPVVPPRSVVPFLSHKLRSALGCAPLSLSSGAPASERHSAPALVPTAISPAAAIGEQIVAIYLGATHYFTSDPSAMVAPVIDAVASATRRVVGDAFSAPGDDAWRVALGAKAIGELATARLALAAAVAARMRGLRSAAEVASSLRAVVSLGLPPNAPLVAAAGAALAHVVRAAGVSLHGATEGTSLDPHTAQAIAGCALAVVTEVHGAATCVMVANAAHWPVGALAGGVAAVADVYTTATATVAAALDAYGSAYSREALVMARLSPLPGAVQGAAAAALPHQQAYKRLETPTTATAIMPTSAAGGLVVATANDPSSVDVAAYTALTAAAHALAMAGAALARHLGECTPVREADDARATRSARSGRDAGVLSGGGATFVITQDAGVESAGASGLDAVLAKASTAIYPSATAHTATSWGPSQGSGGGGVVDITAVEELIASRARAQGVQSSGDASATRGDVPPSGEASTSSPGELMSSSAVRTLAGATRVFVHLATQCELSVAVARRTAALHVLMVSPLAATTEALTGGAPGDGARRHGVAAAPGEHLTDGAPVAMVAHAPAPSPEVAWSTGGLVAAAATAADAIIGAAAAVGRAPRSLLTTALRWLTSSAATAPTAVTLALLGAADGVWAAASRRDPDLSEIVSRAAVAVATAPIAASRFAHVPSIKTLTRLTAAAAATLRCGRATGAFDVPVSTETALVFITDVDSSSPSQPTSSGSSAPATSDTRQSDAFVFIAARLLVGSISTIAASLGSAYAVPTPVSKAQDASRREPMAACDVPAALRLLLLSLSALSLLPISVAAAAVVAGSPSFVYAAAVTGAFGAPTARAILASHAEFAISADTAPSRPPKAQRGQPPVAAPGALRPHPIYGLFGAPAPAASAPLDTSDPVLARLGGLMRTPPSPRASAAPANAAASDDAGLHINQATDALDADTEATSARHRLHPALQQSSLLAKWLQAAAGAFIAAPHQRTALWPAGADSTAHDVSSIVALSWGSRSPAALPSRVPPLKGGPREGGMAGAGAGIVACSPLETSPHLVLPLHGVALSFSAVLAHAVLAAAADMHAAAASTALPLDHADTPPAELLGSVVRALLTPSLGDSQNTTSATSPRQRSGEAPLGAGAPTSARPIHHIEDAWFCSRPVARRVAPMRPPRDRHAWTMSDAAAGSPSPVDTLWSVDDLAANPRDAVVAIVPSLLPQFRAVVARLSGHVFASDNDPLRLLRALLLANVAAVGLSPLPTLAGPVAGGGTFAVCDALLLCAVSHIADLPYFVSTVAGGDDAAVHILSVIQGTDAAVLAELRAFVSSAITATGGDDPWAPTTAPLVPRRDGRRGQAPSHSTETGRGGPTRPVSIGAIAGLAAWEAAAAAVALLPLRPPPRLVRLVLYLAHVQRHRRLASDPQVSDHGVSL